MNDTCAKKGANSQRFYGCAYNENGTNVRRADGEIDKMHEKDVVTKRHTFPKDEGEKIGVVHLTKKKKTKKVNVGSLSTRRLYYIYCSGADARRNEYTGQNEIKRERNNERMEEIISIRTYLNA